MPFYSAFTASGYLINNLQELLEQKSISSFALSKLASLSPQLHAKFAVMLGTSLSRSSRKDIPKSSVSRRRFRNKEYNGIICCSRFWCSLRLIML